ncbi:MAG: hypothetical protein IKI95_08395 [Clostridia bacterium]|nr:hypothetical protein [Clostridia bacterium]
MKKTLFFMLSMILFLFVGTACSHSHTYGNWEVETPATYFKDGEERRYCKECGEYESKKIEKLFAKYIITAKVGNTEILIGVGEDGEYTIANPVIDGLEILGWKDNIGNEFSLTGTIDDDITIYADIQATPTTTFEQLKTRIESGVSKILIAENITLTDTIYVYDNVEIYTTENHTLTRDTNFTGDLFVIGEDKNGNDPILENRTVTLSLKTESDSTLTFDGNKSSVEKTVVGSAFYITNSSTLEMYDGVVLTNFKKLGNDRINKDYSTLWDSANLAGGSVVLNTYGTFNMYGGIISNNESNLLDSTPNPNLPESDYVSSYGGAIYNRSTFNMYGGTIQNNRSGRGGAIYNYRSFNLEKGNLLSNASASYGGAIYLPNSQLTTLVIGDEEASETVVNISYNTSDSSGGAIFAQTLTNFIIYNGVNFEENSATGNGGAIATSGPLLATGATFVNNVTTSKGAALHIYYRDDDNTPRCAEIRDCTFTGNSAEYGAAISLYASESSYEQGAIVEVDNCTFTKNTTTSNGGAVYVARSSQLTLNNSLFDQNSTTATNYGGGALYFTNSTGEISNTTFTNNTSTYNAGALAIYASSEVKMTNVSFVNNSAENNGGAVYISKSKVKETSNLVFSENTAVVGGGMAVYDNTSNVNITTVNADKNEAEENGGFLYISAATVTISKGENNSLISLNTAGENGGAVSVHSAGTLNLYGLTFTSNQATKNGGAINLKGATINIGDAQNYTGDNLFNLNTAVNYGGAIFVETSSTNNSLFNAYKLTLTGNSANNGGGLYLASGKGDSTYTTIPTATIKTLIVSENTATNNGGALYAYTNSVVVIDSLQATKNSSENYGGFSYISGKANVEIKSATASENSSPKGGFIYITTTGTALTILQGTFTNNTADEGKFIYSNSSGVTIKVSSTAVTYDENGFAGKGEIKDIEE